MKPGIYDALSNADYHSAPGLSKSGLDLIAKSPAHYKWAQDNPQPETPAMQKGSLVHLLVLEPEKFADEYVVMPPTIKQRRGKEWEAFAADNGHRQIILASQMEEAQRIVGAVHSNAAAMRIMERAVAIEQSIFAEDFATGALLKCRPDIRIDGALYDLKTTRNANARSFAYSCRSYRYHVQAAFYLDVCRMQGLDVDGFGFIAVDTDAMPYQCTVFHRMDDESVEMGRQEYAEDLRRYAECAASGEWPGYPAEYDVLSIGGHAWSEEEPNGEAGDIRAAVGE